MGLFEIATSILSNSLSGGTLGSTQPGGLSTQNVLGSVLSVLNNQPGGLSGVVDSLSKGGLQDVVANWIGNGPNPPVPPTRVQGALGTGVLDEIAGKLGVSPDMAGTVVSQVLPHIVDHLTPDGQIPPGGLTGAGSELLNNILNGSFGSSPRTGR